MSEDMDTKCSACRGAILGNVSNKPRHDLFNMPYGPISEENYELVVSFWCSSCGLKFKHPPGKPEAAKQLLSKERRRIAKIQEDW